MSTWETMNKHGSNEIMNKKQPSPGADMEEEVRNKDIISCLQKEWMGETHLCV